MIVVEKLCLRAGKFRLKDVSLTVPTGAYGVLMGKTGAGKTTILESIIGLRSIDSGRIVLHDLDVTRLRPALRGVGYVPQDGALFSTMTVRDQVALGLTVRGVPAATIAARVDELAGLLDIAHLLDRYPLGLSGGEQQRVALGRAISYRPRVLCLDEPLSALDDDTRGQMMTLLGNVTRQTGVTALHITHNRREAEELGDCIFRIDDGRIVVERSRAVEPKP